MLLRHMCLRTGVDLGHFFLPLSFVLIWGWGVPGSEKLVVRVVQLLLILCYIPPKQKAWRWRYFGMPFTKRSLIQSIPSINIPFFFPLLLVLDCLVHHADKAPWRLCPRESACPEQSTRGFLLHQRRTMLSGRFEGPWLSVWACNMPLNHIALRRLKWRRPSAGSSSFSFFILCKVAPARSAEFSLRARPMSCSFSTILNNILRSGHLL